MTPSLFPDLDAEVVEARRERARERDRRWREANPERARDLARERERRYRETNPEKAREKARRWKDNNPDRSARDQLLRRARKAGNGTFVVLDRDRRRILSSPCLACGSTDRVSIDHRVPISRGGHDGVGNYAPLCCACNNSKHDLTYAEWKHSDRPRARLVFGTNPTERNER